jgi:hypothetical protein
MYNSNKFLLISVLTASLLSMSMVHAQGSENLSKGSAQVSQGSITLGKGASQVLASSAKNSAVFVVDVIEVVGDVAEIMLVSTAKTSQAATQITVSLASSALTSLVIVAGAVIEVMAVYAENKLDILGYLLLQKGEVMIFVSPEGSTLTISSEVL